MKRKKKQQVFALVSLFVILVLLCFLSILFGAVLLSPADTWNSLTCGYNNVCSTSSNIFVDTLIWQVRMPRIVLAGLVGLLLALSGVIMQGVLRNPLADPYILGVSAGGGVGAVLAQMLGLNFVFYGMSAIPLFAFLGALIAVMIVYGLAVVSGRTTTETLLLSGVAVSAFCSGLISLMVIRGGDLQSIYFWLLGSLSGASWNQVITLLPYAIIGLGITYYYSKDLNALLLGEEIAHSLGVEVEKVRFFLLIVASFMAAAAVSVAGMVGFIGLMIPHFVRLIVGPHHRWLVPLAALSGMLLMILADIPARSILAPMELPLGVVMAFIGAPFFLYLLRRRSNY